MDVSSETSGVYLGMDLKLVDFPKEKQWNSVD